MINLLSVLFLVLTAEAASYIQVGSGVTNSISDTEIDVSWSIGSSTGSVKASYVTALLLGGGGVVAKETVSGEATRCTLRGLSPGSYHSIYVQPVYSAATSGNKEELGDNVRIGTFRTLDASKSPATLIVGIFCGIVCAVCVVLVVLIFRLKRQQNDHAMDRNLANAYDPECAKDVSSTYSEPAVEAVPSALFAPILQATPRTQIVYLPDEFIPSVAYWSLLDK
ncbi:hypothetical protein SprV_0802581300 [Sparganum proliferum]